MNRRILTRSSILATALALASLMPCVTLASNIVYTGVPTSQSNLGWSYSLNYGQSLAAEFSIGSSTTITSVEGYMNSLYGNPTATITISQDAGDIPGSTIFSGNFTGAPGEGWQGLSSLNWILGAGTYWVTFNNPGGSGGMAGLAPFPLLNEAYTNSGNWYGQDSLYIGVWIQGESNSVADSGATLALLVGTFIGLAAFRSRFVK